MDSIDRAHMLVIGSLIVLLCISMEVMILLVCLSVDV